MRNRVARLFLWYFGWLVIAPLLGWGIGTRHFAVAALAFVCLAVCLFFGLRKFVCPHCRHAMRTISYRIKNCPQCGTAYSEPA